MTGWLEDPQDREGELRLSHRLVALHVGGMILLIIAVLGSVLWVTVKHNELAESSSQDLVRGGVTSFRVKVETLVKDYSVWDEAYEAVLGDDREWLYRNIGSAVTEVGTLDLIAFVEPQSGHGYGWNVDSPQGGQETLPSAEVRAAMLDLLYEGQPSSVPVRSAFLRVDGELWAFSVTAVTPLAGKPDAVPLAELPVQIHGLHISQERLDELGQSLLVDGLRLAEAPAAGLAAVSLHDNVDDPIGYIVWEPPQPGGRILQQVAIPLGIALAIAMAISAVSSLYAVRAARRLERAFLAAQAADRSKTEFLSNVSHELRTPMNGILGATQLLEMSRLDEEQLELVGLLHSSANAQMALISDLLDWTRLEGGNRPLRDTPFEPAAVLAEVATMMRLAAKDKRIGFESDWPGLIDLTVRGDERAFRQILTNLLGNAVKFTERGRVELRAWASRGTDRAEIAVEVRDTGRGIPSEALGRIFERFYRVDASSTRETQGTGLGLAISKRLSELMGGSIEVVSDVGTGSTFTYRVSLEVVDRSPEARDAA